MSFRTPVQIEQFIAENQYRLDMPQQFYGDEPNTYSFRAGGPKTWDVAKVRMLVFASWPYEQAAGNQSIPLVYKTVNEASPDFLCDRSYFYATPRDWNIFQKGGIPVFGVEHRHQLKDYDVAGSSISYPVLAINMMKQLQISGVPIRYIDRTSRANEYPWVIVGGQSFGAPEGLANAVDAYWCGEVEDEKDNPGIGAVLRRVQDFKEDGSWSATPESRIECYRKLAREFNFLYFPRFIDIHYDYEENRESVRRVIGRDPKPSKQVVGYSSNVEGMRIPVVKRFVKDMNTVVGLDNPPLLYIDPGMGAGDLEVGRGCPAWCSFCALTYRQKPYRQRDVDYMVTFGQNLLRNTGGLHVAPFSPDFPMHTNKKKLVSALLANVTDEVDASSMRVDDFIADSEYILLQAHGGMDQVTLGVEGNSQRMRDLVGKGCADEDIIEAVARGIRAGVRRFKLYMICDLPGEDEGDIYRILNLAKTLADVRDSMGQHTVKIQFSWTPLLVEANTPFQWFAPTVTNRALGQVWDEFRDIKIDFKLGSKSEKNKQTYFQLNQRSSREAGMAIVDVVEAMPAGCWGGVAKGTYEKLEEALINHGFLNGYGDVFDERAKHDMFGWEWLNQGINVELLWVTYQQMKEFLENTDSETYDRNFDVDYHGSEWIERCDTKCYGKTCGTCDVKDLQIRRDYVQAAAEEVNVDLMNVKVVDQKSVAQKLRIRVDKDEAKRFAGNDHWKYAVRRAFNRAQWAVRLEGCTNLVSRDVVGHAAATDVAPCGECTHCKKVPGAAKRSLIFASDKIKFKDFTSGADFLEVGLTRRLSGAALDHYMDVVKKEIRGLSIDHYVLHPANSAPLRSDVDLSFWSMEIETDWATAQRKVQEWKDAEYVEMTLKEESQRGGTIIEKVNAKEFVDDIWVIRDGFKTILRMLLRGKPSPYNVYQAFLSKNSYIEAIKYPATRIDAFAESDSAQVDFFRPDCIDCGRGIPVSLLDEPYDPDRCPRCKDALSNRELVGV